MLEDLKLHLLNFHTPQIEQIVIMNSVYDSWKRVFTEVVQAVGGTLDPDDFFRSDYVLAVSSGSELVAFCNLTFFDLRLRSSLEHHYMKALKTDLPAQLRFQGLQCLLAVEYLTVHPDWRKKKSEVPWLEVLTGLTLKIMDDSYADAVIGTPRIDLKVPDACKILESREIQEPITKMSYPCAVILFEKQKQRKFKNPVTQKYVQDLLQTLTDKDLSRAHLQIKQAA